MTRKRKQATQADVLRAALQESTYQLRLYVGTGPEHAATLAMIERHEALLAVTLDAKP